ncbi:Cof-type HAD-IIB family hydrolase [Parasporobacterium paucivorans]|nr:Cof-type HAD-IIB family hydrolase [Parasporobacterium paucivorans]
MKKMVFFDIDGTIYDYEKGIPESTIVAIKRIREKGALAIINTGRTRAMIFDEILNIGFDGIIAGGGTYVEHQGKILADYNMEPEEAKELIINIRKHGFVPLPEGRDYLYFDEHELNEEFVKIYNIYKSKIPDRILPIDYTTMQAAKVSGRFTKISDWEGLNRQLGGKYNIVNHGNHLIEVLPGQYSKAVGIQTLLDHLKLEKVKTYAFGDSFNDLEMLRFVEHGILMGNADPEMKKLFNLHTTDIFNDGIYNGLDKCGLL